MQLSMVYSLHLPAEGWPGWVDLGDWLHTKLSIQEQGQCQINETEVETVANCSRPRPRPRSNNYKSHNDIVRDVVWPKHYDRGEAEAKCLRSGPRPLFWSRNRSKGQNFGLNAMWPRILNISGGRTYAYKRHLRPNSTSEQSYCIKRTKNPKNQVWHMRLIGLTLSVIGVEEGSFNAKHQKSGASRGAHFRAKPLYVYVYSPLRQKYKYRI